MNILHRLLALSLGYSILAPSMAIAQDALVPYEIDFVLTAYYSPLPDQCCYVKGNYEADKVLNGQGTHGADGTPVYPGMIAAPPSYPFGTRVVLPGIGTLTVHDRGGAIQEWEDSHRIDIWAGSGEEGLARALAFGVQRVRGTVYLPGTQQPPESINLALMPAPQERLKPYVVSDTGVLDAHPKLGQSSLSVKILQEQLASAGYFHHAVTGFFGDVTKSGLQAFIVDMKLSETAEEVTDATAIYLKAAAEVQTDKTPVELIDASSPAREIKKAQRLLRFLGHYRGRTDGVFSDALFNAIVSFQQSEQLVGDATSPGAGRIGPMTKERLTKAWTHNRVEKRAGELLAKERVRETLAERGDLVDETMAEGYVGEMVEAVQRALSRRGFFPADKVNGVFGVLTRDSVLQYQLKRGIIESENDTGAGVVGPMTLQAIRAEQVDATYNVVRAQGWQAL